MKETLKLQKPIMVDGEARSEFSYDVDEITVDLYSEACDKASKPGKIDVAESDYSLHLYIGLAAIIAVNPGIEFSDLCRIKGRDLMKVVGIGRNFILLGSADAVEELSEDASENTAEPSTPAPKASKEKE